MAVTGQAEVRNGGRIDAEGIVIGSLAGSTQADLLVTGSNSGTPSTVDINGYLYVGDARKGTMTVEQGAEVRVATSDASQRIFIGDNAAADGSKLTVTGAGSRVDYFGTGDVSVGNAGGSTATAQHSKSLTVAFSLPSSRARRSSRSSIRRHSTTVTRPPR